MTWGECWHRAGDPPLNAQRRRKRITRNCFAVRTLTQRDAITLAALGRYDDSIATFQSGSLAANGAEAVYFYPGFDPIRQDARFRKALADSGATAAHDRAQAWRKAPPPEETK